MWFLFFALSVLSLPAVWLLAESLNAFRRSSGKRLNLFRALFGGVFAAVFFMFLPPLLSSSGGVIRGILLSLFTSMQVFTLGTEFNAVAQQMADCPQALMGLYQIWAAALFVLAPVFTFGFVLSLFKNLSATVKYWSMFFRQMFIFSQLNEKSMTLAEDIRKKHPKAGIVFTDVTDEEEEKGFDWTERAKALRAICFRRDVQSVAFGRHSKKRELSFFAVGEDEQENLDHALGLIESYQERNNTHVYLFSTQIESELLLSSVSKGKVKLRRINQVRSLINRVLYERGEILFEHAIPQGEEKEISAVILGMGSYGTEMLKALTWFCQMDGYSFRVDAFSEDPLAGERFCALAPELMSESYNGVAVKGEARYSIRIHSGIREDTKSFADLIRSLEQVSYVFVALGDDERNIRAAVNLRMLFERMHLRPVIQAVVTDSRQKKALSGLTNYRGQAYDIELIGDIESSYAEDVILDSELEEEALRRHLKWGKEEEFWAYEYNYRSSAASAIHMAARIKCGIPGAEKSEEELTDSEREGIEQLEHRRWNAYMRAEGYVYSGSPDKKSRNDLGKMHHDLVDFDSLSEEEKRKDSRVGTK